MRIYEFGKKHNIPNSELVKALKSEGFDIKSHMSALSDDAFVFLEERFLGRSKEKAELIQKKVIKKEVIPSIPEKKPTKYTQKPATLEKKVEKKIPFRRPQAPKPIRQEKKQLEPIVPTEITLEPMNVGVAAERLGQSVNEVIVTLLRWGVVAAKNQLINEETVKRLAEHYEIATVKPIRQQGEQKKEHDFDIKDLKERLPIVVVLGHVDHGKTTLLDHIRKTRVAAKEKGGITQHLGAYQATTPQGNIVFLDTPGHEAFPKMRQRGARVADIAVLVVAADDGVMPQTVEAIKHAKSMNLPIMVAINKIDKVEPSQLEVVRRQLAQHDLLPEDWGGQTVCVPISAQKGTGVDQLLEMIILQSQLMELSADPESPAKGYILESKIAKGHGPVATFMPQHGAISVGDYFICGNTVGKVSVLTDSLGKRVQKSGPAIPIQITGFESLPEAGDFLEVVSKGTYLQSRSVQKDTKSVGHRLIQEGAVNIILKVDSVSSKEAVIDALHKVSKKGPVGFNIIDARVGDISEGDIELAFNTGAEIIGLHVKAATGATDAAKRRKVPLRLFTVIYKLLEELEARLEQEREIEMVSVKVGEATVRKVFDIKGIGVIAGCYVSDGRIVREGSIVGWRGKQKIGEGSITSLQRDKKSVKEVHAGFECGFVVSGIDDWQEDDRAECYIKEPKK